MSYDNEANASTCTGNLNFRMGGNGSAEHGFRARKTLYMFVSHPNALHTPTSDIQLEYHPANMSPKPGLLCSAPPSKYYMKDQQKSVSCIERTCHPPVLGTPTKGGSTSQPRTPVSPRKGVESPSLLLATSEMDVSNVDREQVLVDNQTVEPGDVSFDAEDHAVEEDGADDRVMVSIRMSPLNNPSTMSPKSLLPAYHNPTTPAPTSTFDSILPGRKTNLYTSPLRVNMYTPQWRGTTQSSLHMDRLPQDRHTCSQETKLNRVSFPALHRTSSHTSATCQRGNTSSAATSSSQPQIPHDKWTMPSSTVAPSHVKCR
ncbi:hypothetical protein BDQ17DRAFT_1434496 [Cyathus striatus]|nr:hypothetical protein BDQ17DRAFT_1434496 [Cyathus striatus]